MAVSTFNKKPSIDPWASKIPLVFLICSVITVTTYCLPKHAFNLDRIHALYQNGDFEQLIKELVAFEKSGRTCSYNDSIFLEKHLSVVYASNPATRELGRYHMYKLLNLAPAAELLDMFVGEEVDKVFEKVRKEHALANKNENSKNPSTGNLQSKVSANSTKAPTTIRKRVLAASKPETKSISLAPKPKPAPTPTTSLLQVELTPQEIKRPAPLTTGEIAALENEIAPPASEVPPPNQQPLALPSDTVPLWSQKGVWIGGGTALALVAFTLYYSGSPKETSTKTYVVPATATK